MDSGSAETYLSSPIVGQQAPTRDTAEEYTNAATRSGNDGDGDGADDGSISRGAQRVHPKLAGENQKGHLGSEPREQSHAATAMQPSPLPHPSSPALSGADHVDDAMMPTPPAATKGAAFPTTSRAIQPHAAEQGEVNSFTVASAAALPATPSEPLCHPHQQRRSPTVTRTADSIPSALHRNDEEVEAVQRLPQPSASSSAGPLPQLTLLPFVSVPPTVFSVAPRDEEEDGVLQMSTPPSPHEGELTTTHGTAEDAAHHCREHVPSAAAAPPLPSQPSPSSPPGEPQRMKRTVSSPVQWRPRAEEAPISPPQQQPPQLTTMRHAPSARNVAGARSLDEYTFTRSDRSLSSLTATTTTASAASATEAKATSGATEHVAARTTMSHLRPHAHRVRGAPSPLAAATASTISSTSDSSELLQHGHTSRSVPTRSPTFSAHTRPMVTNTLTELMRCAASHEDLDAPRLIIPKDFPITSVLVSWGGGSTNSGFALPEAAAPPPLEGPPLRRTQRSTDTTATDTAATSSPLGGADHTSADQTAMRFHRSRQELCPAGEAETDSSRSSPSASGDASHGRPGGRHRPPQFTNVCLHHVHGESPPVRHSHHPSPPLPQAVDDGNENVVSFLSGPLSSLSSQSETSSPSVRGGHHGKRSTGPEGGDAEAGTRSVFDVVGGTEPASQGSAALGTAPHTAATTTGNEEEEEEETASRTCEAHEGAPHASEEQAPEQKAADEHTAESEAEEEEEGEVLPMPEFVEPATPRGSTLGIRGGARASTTKELTTTTTTEAAAADVPGCTPSFPHERGGINDAHHPPGKRPEQSQRRKRKAPSHAVPTVRCVQDEVTVDTVAPREARQGGEGDNSEEVASSVSGATRASAARETTGTVATQTATNAFTVASGAAAMATAVLASSPTTSSASTVPAGVIAGAAAAAFSSPVTGSPSVKVIVVHDVVSSSEDDDHGSGPLAPGATTTTTVSLTANTESSSAPDAASGSAATVMASAAGAAPPLTSASASSGGGDGGGGHVSGGVHSATDPTAGTLSDAFHDSSPLPNSYLSFSASSANVSNTASHGIPAARLTDVTTAAATAAAVVARLQGGGRHPAAGPASDAHSVGVQGESAGSSMAHVMWERETREGLPWSSGARSHPTAAGMAPTTTTTTTAMTAEAEQMNAPNDSFPLRSPYSFRPTLTASSAMFGSSSGIGIASSTAAAATAVAAAASTGAARSGTPGQFAYSDMDAPLNMLHSSVSELDDFTGDAIDERSSDTMNALDVPPYRRQRGIMPLEESSVTGGNTSYTSLLHRPGSATLTSGTGGGGGGGSGASERHVMTPSPFHGFSPMSEAPLYEGVAASPPPHTFTTNVPQGTHSLLRQQYPPPTPLAGSSTTTLTHATASAADVNTLTSERSLAAGTKTENTASEVREGEAATAAGTATAVTGVCSAPQPAQSYAEEEKRHSHRRGDSDPFMSSHAAGSLLAMSRASFPRSGGEDGGHSTHPAPAPSSSRVVRPLPLPATSAKGVDVGGKEDDVLSGHGTTTHGTGLPSLPPLPPQSSPHQAAMSRSRAGTPLSTPPCSLLSHEGCEDVHHTGGGGSAHSPRRSACTTTGAVKEATSAPFGDPLLFGDDSHSTPLVTLVPAPSFWKQHEDDDEGGSSEEDVATSVAVAETAVASDDVGSEDTPLPPAMAHSDRAITPQFPPLAGVTSTRSASANARTSDSTGSGRPLHLIGLPPLATGHSEQVEVASVTAAATPNTMATAALTHESSTPALPCFSEHFGEDRSGDLGSTSALATTMTTATAESASGRVVAHHSAKTSTTTPSSTATGSGNQCTPHTGEPHRQHRSGWPSSSPPPPCALASVDRGTGAAVAAATILDGAATASCGGSRGGSRAVSTGRESSTQSGPPPPHLSATPIIATSTTTTATTATTDSRNRPPRPNRSTGARRGSHRTTSSSSPLMTPRVGASESSGTLTHGRRRTSRVDTTQTTTENGAESTSVWTSAPAIVEVPAVSQQAPPPPPGATSTSAAVMSGSTSDDSAADDSDGGMSNGGVMYSIVRLAAMALLPKKVARSVSRQFNVPLLWILAPFVVVLILVALSTFLSAYYMTQDLLSSALMELHVYLRSEVVSMVDDMLMVPMMAAEVITGVYVTNRTFPGDSGFTQLPLHPPMQYEAVNRVLCRSIQQSPLSTMFSMLSVVSLEGRGLIASCRHNNGTYYVAVPDREDSALSPGERRRYTRVKQVDPVTLNMVSPSVDLVLGNPKTAWDWVKQYDLHDHLEFWKNAVRTGNTQTAESGFWRQAPFDRTHILYFYPYYIPGTKQPSMIVAHINSATWLRDFKAAADLVHTDSRVMLLGAHISEGAADVCESVVLSCSWCNGELSTRLGEADTVSPVQVYRRRTETFFLNTVHLNDDLMESAVRHVNVNAVVKQSALFWSIGARKSTQGLVSSASPLGGGGFRVREEHYVPFSFKGEHAAVSASIVTTSSNFTLVTVVVTPMSVLEVRHQFFSRYVAAAIVAVAAIGATFAAYYALVWWVQSPLTEIVEELHEAVSMYAITEDGIPVVCAPGEVNSGTEEESDETMTSNGDTLPPPKQQQQQQQQKLANEQTSSSATACAGTATEDTNDVHTRGAASAIAIAITASVAKASRFLVGLVHGLATLVNPVTEWLRRLPMHVTLTEIRRVRQICAQLRQRMEEVREYLPESLKSYEGYPEEVALTASAANSPHLTGLHRSQDHALHSGSQSQSVLNVSPLVETPLPSSLTDAHTGTSAAAAVHSPLAESLSPVMQRPPQSDDSVVEPPGAKKGKTTRSSSSPAASATGGLDRSTASHSSRPQPGAPLLPIATKMLAAAATATARGAPDAFPVASSTAAREASATATHPPAPPASSVEVLPGWLHSVNAMFGTDSVPKLPAATGVTTATTATGTVLPSHQSSSSSCASPAEAMWRAVEATVREAAAHTPSTVVVPSGTLASASAGVVALAASIGSGKAGIIRSSTTPPSTAAQHGSPLFIESFAISAVGGREGVGGGEGIANEESVGGAVGGEERSATAGSLGSSNTGSLAANASGVSTGSRPRNFRNSLREVASRAGQAILHRANVSQSGAAPSVVSDTGVTAAAGAAACSAAASTTSGTLPAGAAAYSSAHTVRIISDGRRVRKEFMDGIVLEVGEDDEEPVGEAAATRTSLATSTARAATAGAPPSTAVIRTDNTLLTTSMEGHGAHRVADPPPPSASTALIVPHRDALTGPATRTAAMTRESTSAAAGAAVASASDSTHVPDAVLVDLTSPVMGLGSLRLRTSFLLPDDVSYEAFQRGLSQSAGFPGEAGDGRPFSLENVGRRDGTPTEDTTTTAPIPRRLLGERSLRNINCYTKCFCTELSIHVRIGQDRGALRHASEIMELVVEAAQKYGGSFDIFVPEMIYISFGSRSRMKDHALLAVKCGIEIYSRVSSEALNYMTFVVDSGVYYVGVCGVPERKSFELWGRPSSELLFNQQLLSGFRFLILDTAAPLIRPYFRVLPVDLINITEEPGSPHVVLYCLFRGSVRSQEWATFSKQFRRVFEAVVAANYEVALRLLEQLDDSPYLPFYSMHYRAFCHERVLSSNRSKLPPGEFTRRVNEMNITYSQHLCQRSNLCMPFGAAHPMYAKYISRRAGADSIDLGSDRVPTTHADRTSTLTQQSNASDAVAAPLTATTHTNSSAGGGHVTEGGRTAGGSGRGGRGFRTNRSGANRGEEGLGLYDYINDTALASDVDGGETRQTRVGLDGNNLYMTTTTTTTGTLTNTTNSAETGEVSDATTSSPSAERSAYARLLHTTSASVQGAGSGVGSAPNSGEGDLPEDSSTSSDDHTPPPSTSEQWWRKIGHGGTVSGKDTSDVGGRAGGGGGRGSSGGGGGGGDGFSWSTRPGMAGGAERISDAPFAPLRMAAAAAAAPSSSEEERRTMGNAIFPLVAETYLAGRAPTSHPTTMPVLQSSFDGLNVTSLPLVVVDACHNTWRRSQQAVWSEGARVAFIGMSQSGSMARLEMCPSFASPRLRSLSSSSRRRKTASSVASTATATSSEHSGHRYAGGGGGGAQSVPKRAGGRQPTTPAMATVVPPAHTTPKSAVAGPASSRTGTSLLQPTTLATSAVSTGNAPPRRSGAAAAGAQQRPRRRPYHTLRSATGASSSGRGTGGSRADSTFPSDASDDDGVVYDGNSGEGQRLAAALRRTGSTRDGSQPRPASVHSGGGTVIATPVARSEGDTTASSHTTHSRAPLSSSHFFSAAGTSSENERVGGGDVEDGVNGGGGTSVFANEDSGNDADSDPTDHSGSSDASRRSLQHSRSSSSFGETAEAATAVPETTGPDVQSTAAGRPLDATMRTLANTSLRTAAVTSGSYSVYPHAIGYRFATETEGSNAQAISSIARTFYHENIVQYISKAVIPGTSYVCIISEYVPGGTLQEAVERYGRRLPVGAVRRYCVSLLRALDYLHREKRVVHGFLRPENVVVGVDGQCRMIGMSYFFDWAGVRHAPELESACYNSPEVNAGAAKQPSSDVFSFGLLLLEMLMGTKPWTWWGAQDEVPGRNREELLNVLQDNKLFLQSFEEGGLELCQYGRHKNGYNRSLRRHFAETNMSAFPALDVDDSTTFPPAAALLSRLAREAEKRSSGMVGGAGEGGEAGDTPSRRNPTDAPEWLVVPSSAQPERAAGAVSETPLGVTSERPQQRRLPSLFSPTTAHGMSIGAVSEADSTLSGVVLGGSEDDIDNSSDGVREEDEEEAELASTMSASSSSSTRVAARRSTEVGGAQRAVCGDGTVDGDAERAGHEDGQPPPVSSSPVSPTTGSFTGANEFDPLMLTILESSLAFDPQHRCTAAELLEMIVTGRTDR